MPPLCLQRGHVCQLQTQTSQVLVSLTLPILAFILQLFNAIPTRNSAHLDVALHGLDVVGELKYLTLYLAPSRALADHHIVAEWVG